MKNIVEYINEASRNEKHRRERFAKSFFSGNKAKGGFREFGIITAENPNSQELPAQENKKLMDEFRGLLKKDQLTTVNLDGKFGGNVEHSLLVFDVKLETLKFYAGKYEQTSFFYCYPEGDKVISEYWEKTHDGEPYDEKENPYKLINKTDVYHNEKDAKDNFSVIGGDFKYTIDTAVFSEAK